MNLRRNSWGRFFGAFGLLLCSIHGAFGTGYSLQFVNDGNLHSVMVPFVPELQLYPFTVTAWIKAGAQPSDGTNATPIVSKPNIGFDGWNLSIFNGNLRASYYSGGLNYVSDAGANTNGGLNGGLVGDGQWHHVAFTVDAGGGKIYVDGVLRTNRTWVGTPGPALSLFPIYLGRGGSPAQYVGLLDEVSLWNVALTQAQIQTNQNRSLSGYQPGLVAYYRCDESTGPISSDSAPAGGANDGSWNTMSAVPSNAPISALPTVQTLAASALGQTFATLNGLVNPQGTNTTAWFEWGATTNYGNVTPAVSVGGGTSDINYSRDLTGLASFTAYHFRAVASNSVGAAFGTNQTFTTAFASPPYAATLLASSVFGESAILNGQVSPNGATTLTWFDWGTTTNYGNVTPAQAAGNGLFALNVSRTITTIPFGSNCHYRVVASNNVGVTRGLDMLAQPQLFTPGTDINLITGTETWPRVTQNEPAIWSHGTTIVAAYNDSRGLSGIGPYPSFGGVSVSTNGGATFTRLNYFFNQFGRCGGRPSVFYSLKTGKWYVSFLSDLCGDYGIGLWESTNGLNWAHTLCVVGPGTAVADGPSTWVDNNPGSAYYGRQYVAFNDFGSGTLPPLGQIRSGFSVNNGTNWVFSLMPPIPTRRAGKITGSRGNDGTVFLPILDESGGGTNLTRVHYLARSTNGGGSWIFVQVTAPVRCPGLSTSGYWAGMYDAPQPAHWWEMGWGQAGVGPGGVVHYTYSASTTNPPYDANIFYTRSADNGLTWSTPIQLNTDDSLQRQWNPSISVNSRGTVLITWYDERKSPGDLEYYGRASLDNGVTWGIDAPISDAPFRRPYQGDPLVATNFFGFYSFATFGDDGDGDIAYHAWVDGRVVLQNTYVQQDVFFDRITLGSEMRITSINRAQNGDLILLGTGRPNLGHSLQTSTNLAPGNFSTVATVTPTAYGAWKHNAGPLVSGSRFYRLSLP